MRRVLPVLLGASLLAGLIGCSQCGNRLTNAIHGSCQKAPENCAGCNGLCRRCAQSGEDPNAVSCDDPECPVHGRCRRHIATDQPATGAVTYPYYTTRGPRDFLARNPPSIGP